MRHQDNRVRDVEAESLVGPTTLTCRTLGDFLGERIGKCLKYKNLPGIEFG